MLITVIISIMLVGTVVYAEELNYTDVNSTDWFYSYINNAVKAGAVNGYPDGTYLPNRAVTRGEFIKIIVSALIDKNITVNTSGQHWAYDYFVAINNMYLLPDTVTVATLDEQCTREEMAYILSKVVFNVLGEPAEGTAGVQKLINDYTTIGTSYQSHVVDTYARGLIGGDPNGNFSPQKSMTRAETATVLTRVLYKEQRLKVDTGVTEVDLSKVTYDLTDPERGAAKVGDVVLGADGKLYTVEVDQKIKDKYHAEVIGAGIPVALDLGKEDLIKRDGTAATYVTDGKSCANPKSKYFGQRYTVYNGEGHYSSDWTKILGAYYPGTDGTYNGQVDETNYFEWSSNDSSWLVRFGY
jgi:hypothetical protein